MHNMPNWMHGRIGRSGVNFEVQILLVLLAVESSIILIAATSIQHRKIILMILMNIVPILVLAFC